MCGERRKAAALAAVRRLLCATDSADARSQPDSAHLCLGRRLAARCLACCPPSDPLLIEDSLPLQLLLLELLLEVDAGLTAHGGGCGAVRCSSLMQGGERERLLACLSLVCLVAASVALIVSSC